MARLLGIIVVVLLALGTAAAEEDAEMRAAQRELKQARAHLQQADRDYQGHRRQAVEHLDEALREVRAALETKQDKKDSGDHPAKKPAPDEAEDD
jgi:ElaB/YqjD/DUF883 family membrane-anchored ribosome-binding protein